MKTLQCVAVLLVMLALASCKKETMAYESEFERSYQTWLRFKDSSANSYQYVTAQESWTGVNYETRITVQQGKVTGRAFTAKMFANNGTGDFTLLEQWEESDSALLTHVKGAALLTLDDVYEQARQDWLKKRKDAQTYFNANNNGLISYCGYVPDGCQDDCFNGIIIYTIKAI